LIPPPDSPTHGGYLIQQVRANFVAYQVFEADAAEEREQDRDKHFDERYALPSNGA
jgi:hypothetical protein